MAAQSTLILRGRSMKDTKLRTELKNNFFFFPIQRFFLSRSWPRRSFVTQNLVPIPHQIFINYHTRCILTEFQNLQLTVMQSLTVEV